MTPQEELIGRITERAVRELSKPRIPVEASGRHMHISKADIEALFGPGYRLTKRGDLSQPGQYSCVERVRIIGPKGEFPSVVILAPERPETQVEISLTDAKILGIDAPLRVSGDIAGTPGIKIVGPAGEVDIPHGVIVAKRHVHMAAADAASYGLRDGQTVSIRFYGERGVTFHEVPLRVSPDFATGMHIDYDEANAMGFRSGMVGFLEFAPDIFGGEQMDFDVDRLIDIVTKEIIKRLGESEKDPVPVTDACPVDRTAAPACCCAVLESVRDGSVDLRGKHLLHERDLRDHNIGRDSVVRVSKNTIVTALAHDYAKGLGAKIVKGN